MISGNEVVLGIDCRKISHGKNDCFQMICARIWFFILRAEREDTKAGSYPGAPPVDTLDVTGPAEVFAYANRLSDAKSEPYSVKLVCASPDVYLTSGQSPRFLVALKVEVIGALVRKLAHEACLHDWARPCQITASRCDQGQQHDAYRT